MSYLWDDTQPRSNIKSLNPEQRRKSMSNSLGKFKDLFFRFWKSDNEKIAILRDVLIALVAVFIVLLLLWSYTGQWFAAPMVAIESGSMEHEPPTYPSPPFGRLGTIDAGDMVLVKKVYTIDDIVVHGSQAGGAEATNDYQYHTYGDWGDVIIYKPMGQEDVSQIIHRALCWVDISEYQGKIRYTIEEYGVRNESTLIIPELGLHGMQPVWTHSGYLTKGDNNEVIDQVSSICPQPVRFEWVTGKARSEIPWLGTINLLFEDLLHGKDTRNNVHPDSWIMLGIIIVVLISIPVGFDVYDYLKEKKKKQQKP